jgi:hypothetical protein
LLACAALATVASYMIVLACFSAGPVRFKSIALPSIGLGRTDRAVIGSDAE